MKIIKFEAENIKKLVVVEITPQGNVVEITGKNGSGKSSTLDALWWALGGSAGIQDNPIRNGEKAAKTKLDLGDLVVTRTFKATDGGGYTSAIKVENKDGLKYTSPQAALDKLVGDLSFDPLSFARSDGKKQFDLLASFVPGVDFAGIYAANKVDYDKRTIATRKAKDLTAQAGPFDATAPTERIDDLALLNKMETAAKSNGDRDKEDARRLRVMDEANGLDLDAMNADAAAKRLREEADGEEAEAKTLRQQAADKRAAILLLEPLPVVVDVSEVKKQIEEARANNAKVDAREARQRLLRAAEGENQEAERLTGVMEKRIKDKDAAIAAASLPIAGLSFGDGVVLLNGLPFNQASDAEQLRVSIAIAMAKNPKLRVIRVRDGSLLDSDSMKLLADMAKDKDFQVWVETVGGGSPSAIVLEDGQVRAEVSV